MYCYFHSDNKRITPYLKDNSSELVKRLDDLLTIVQSDIKDASRKPSRDLIDSIATFQVRIPCLIITQEIEKHYKNKSNKLNEDFMILTKEVKTISFTSVQIEPAFASQNLSFCKVKGTDKHSEIKLAESLSPKIQIKIGAIEENKAKKVAFETLDYSKNKEPKETQTSKPTDPPNHQPESPPNAISHQTKTSAKPHATPRHPTHAAIDHRATDDQTAAMPASHTATHSLVDSRQAIDDDIIDNDNIGNVV